jgi:hypothetical protein
VLEEALWRFEAAGFPHGFPNQNGNRIFGTHRWVNAQSTRLIIVTIKRKTSGSPLNGKAAFVMK